MAEEIWDLIIQGSTQKIPAQITEILEEAGKHFSSLPAAGKMMLTLRLREELCSKDLNALSRLMASITVVTKEGLKIRKEGEEPIIGTSGTPLNLYVNQRNVSGSENPAIAKLFREIYLAISLQIQQKERIRFDMISAPHSSGLMMGDYLSEHLGIPRVIAYKKPRDHGIPGHASLDTDIYGKKVLVVDDHITTGGTILAAAGIFLKTHLRHATEKIQGFSLLDIVHLMATTKKEVFAKETILEELATTLTEQPDNHVASVVTASNVAPVLFPENVAFLKKLGLKIYNFLKNEHLFEAACLASDPDQPNMYLYDAQQIRLLQKTLHLPTAPPRPALHTGKGLNVIPHHG